MNSSQIKFPHFVKKIDSRMVIGDNLYCLDKCPLTPFPK